MLVKQPRGTDVVRAELALELVLARGLVVGMVECQHGAFVRAIGADGAVVAFGPTTLGGLIPCTVGGITLCLAVCAQLLFDLQRLRKSK